MENAEQPVLASTSQEDGIEERRKEEPVTNPSTQDEGCLLETEMILDSTNPELDINGESEQEEKILDECLSTDFISDEELGEELIGDTWIEELECALLADCDPATLKKISEGRRIPSALRPDYWRALLALNDEGKVKLNSEYDLENQLQIREDCERLVEEIVETLGDEPSSIDKLRLKSDFESTITTYVKARPELSYVPDNGWTDILKVLYHLELNGSQVYQMFFRIVDRYIPKDLACKAPHKDQENIARPQTPSNSSTKLSLSNSTETNDKEPSPQHIPEKQISNQRSDIAISTQAYHLLRLLIQYHDPELCSILESRKVMPNLYVKDWFCSLFARSCSSKIALIIWDTHFKMADPFLIFFAAIVMVVNASDELKKSGMTQADMLTVLKAMPSRLEEDDIEDLYYLVSNHYTNSTPRSIRSYSHLFFMDTFGNTYSGNESPENGQHLLDLKTTQLTNTLDLSQYLCLPIVPAEIFALDNAKSRSSPTQSNTTLRYFLVDCRPSEQYNAGHLTKAFHLDCSLMLREPSSFATAVQALLEIQRHVVASKSNTGGQHLCFIGSGQEEEDQYVNMVVASFLQKYQKYVSIVVGGFEAIHNYVSTKSELKESFDKYIVDHNPELCKICHSKLGTPLDRFQTKKANQSGSFSSAHSLFTSTTNFLRGDKSGVSSAAFNRLSSNQQQATMAANLIAQSSASMIDKFTMAFVSKSSEIKDRLVETLNTTTIPSTSLPSATSQASRSHVSSHDKLGRRYTGSSIRYAIDDLDDDLSNPENRTINEPAQEIQIDSWQKQAQIIAFHKCAQLKGTTKYPGYVALSKSHLWILREIPHNKGFASIVAKRPLDMIVQITSKRRQPDLIIFRYGYANTAQQSSTSRKSDQDDATKAESKSMPSIIASDQLHIPQAFEVIRLIKREIVRIMDGSSKDVRTINDANVEESNKPDIKQEPDEAKEDDANKKDEVK